MRLISSPHDGPTALRLTSSTSEPVSSASSALTSWAVVGVVERLGLDAQPHLALGGEGLHGEPFEPVVGQRVLGLGDGHVAGRHLPHDAALEVDAEVEARAATATGAR